MVIGPVVVTSRSLLEQDALIYYFFFRLTVKSVLT